MLKARMKEVFLQNTNLVGIPNVTSVVCQEEDKFDWKKGYGYQVFFLDLPSQPIDVYFLLDTHNQNAFAHWVFENFVYLPMYKKIKEIYPSCKVLLSERKDYKYMFLKSAGVSPEDIVVAKDVDFQYQVLNKEPIEERSIKPNLVFFHPYASFNGQKVEEYHLQYLSHYLHQIQRMPKEKTIPILYLPRGEKENFTGMDRRYVIQNQCKELVKQLGGTIFETDTNTDYHKQIELVRSAKVILCDYGSNLWVNGFFSEDAHLVFLNIGWRQEYNLPYYGLLYTLIGSKNKSMYNMNADAVDVSSFPNLVYHSFSEVSRILHECINST
jgi:hypothetical protein